MKHKIRIRTICAIVIPVVVVAALTVTGLLLTRGSAGEASWTYNLFTGKLTLSGAGTAEGNDWLNLWEGSIRSVEISDGVTSVPEQAFYGCTALTEVSVGGDVTTVGAGAFYNCTALERISFPQTTTEIGRMAFWGCTSLVEVSIPGVRRLGDSAFEGASRLAGAGLP